MRGYKSEGIILRRVNSGEADRILTIFSKSQGKVRVKAKGVRKITSKKAGSIEQFNLIKFSVAKGHVLDVVTETYALNTFPHLRHNLTLVGVAYHFCELVDRLLPEHQENSAVLALLLAHLDLLNSSTDLSHLSQQVKIFETQLLSLLGFGLPQPLTQQALVNHIESILEKPLKSRRFLLRIATSSSPE